MAKQTEKVEILRSQVMALEQMLQVHEDTVRHQHAKLQQTISDLKEAKERAQEADRAKSEFLANMSHEIRTPMTAILGFTEMLRETMADEKSLEAISTIKRNGNHLLSIINDILDLSKIESGKMEIEHINCSPCQVIYDAVSLMRSKALAKNLNFEVEYQSEIPETINSDPVRLRQIIINLISNAIKFTSRGKVTLAVGLLRDATDKSQMKFEVIDTGIGLSEEQIGKLFQPFSQADASTTRRYGGTGLGLAISKRLAQELGGNVVARSVPNNGSIFTLTVDTGPLERTRMIEDPAECFQPVTHLEEMPEETVESLHDCRVLLAEDGPDNQRLISHFLKNAGVQVAVADNGKTACRLALESHNNDGGFDVILMDMQMPVMNGYQATKKLRAEGYDGAIIALTAHAMSGDRERCLQAGCDDYLAKPLKRNDLLLMVKKYSQAAKAAT